MTTNIGISNKDKIKMAAKDLQDKLRNGDPSIEVMSHDEDAIDITAWVMRPGDEKIVAKRLKEALSDGVA